jgi:DtxR family Mn-dependent transcriptional regulator
MKLNESMEDYLEAILFLETEQRVARVKDIAERIGVVQGSVSTALKSLAEKGLINYEPYRFITLTPAGQTIAREITRRHEVISGFLASVLQLNIDLTEKNACRMEHAMDSTVVDRLVEFIDFINQCPRTGADWIERFRSFRRKEIPDSVECEVCVQRIQVKGSTVL